jgi:hypothetical protein
MNDNYNFMRTGNLWVLQKNITLFQEPRPFNSRDFCGDCIHISLDFALFLRYFERSSAGYFKQTF